MENTGSAHATSRTESRGIWIKFASCSELVLEIQLVLMIWIRSQLSSGDSFSL